jgi:outer membrane protein TolC
MFNNMGRSPQTHCRSILRVAIAWTVLCTSQVLAQPPDDPSTGGGTLTLKAAVELALSDNPGIAAVDSQSAALGAVPSQAGALPDPVLSLNAMNLPTDTFDLDQEPMTQLQLAISQSIPFPGKRKLRRATAEDEARAGEARAAEHRDALRGAVRGAWWRVFAFDRALEIVAQNRDLIRDFVEIAQTKYSVGKGLQQDVLLAQLELSRLLDREVRLRGKRRSAQAQLNALLNRPPDHAVTLARTPPNLQLPQLPAETSLLDRASESRDMLVEQRALLEAAESRLALAERDVYPDFRLGAGYGFRQGNDPLRGGGRPDLFSVMLSVNLPLYSRSKQRKAIDQRGHERAQREYSLNNVMRSVQAEITRNLAHYDAAREQVLLLDTAIIPQARQTVASMLAGYQVNEVDFLNVVNGQLMLYNAQINYWQALSEAKRALAGVAAAVGAENIYE